MINELVQALKKASYDYYNHGNSKISDEEYDKLVDKLKQLDPNNEFLKTVGAPPIGTIVKHKIPMGSQEKLKDKSEIDRWVNQILGLNSNFVLQWKLDGSSLAVNYENGKLVNAVTRGDGYEGEDISINVLKMQNIKKQLSTKFTGSIRGEMMLNISTFKQVFEPLGYKNPRNTVAGLSRDKGFTDLTKHFKVLYYDITGDELRTEVDRINYIKSLGLDVVETVEVNTIDDIMTAYNKLETNRNNINYEIDGVIVRANSIDVQNELGCSSDLRPKGQRCIKFTTNKAETILKDILVTIGHTGAMIPTGVLEPVQIGGVTVSNVLLNNYDYIADLQLTKGCKVIIERAGDVIPRVCGVINKTEDKISPPDKCISCNGALVKDGVNYLCKNEECDGIAIRKVKSWITKRGIKFIGDELLSILYENHNIKEPQDLYKLTEEYLSNVNLGNGVVGTRSKQIIEELNKSKKCTVSDMLGSVCIKFLGRRQVEIIQQVSNNKISSLNDFLNMKVDDLLALEGFKDSKANGIVNGIAKAKPTIEALVAAGVEVVNKEKPVRVLDMDEESAGQKLSNNAFCFTGGINKTDENGKRYTRNMMWEIVQKNGGKVLEDVRVLDGFKCFLVQADPSSTSSKTKKAQKLGVNIISEEEFFKMIGE